MWRNLTVSVMGLCTLAVLLAFPGSSLMESVANDKKAAPDQGAASSTITEWEGSESELSDPFIGVISGREEWDSLWRRAFGTTAPPVDFAKYGIACVFLGHYPGWWYKINISEPVREGNSLIVGYELVSLVVEIEGDSPFGEQGSRGPYRMKVVAKRPGFTFQMKEVGITQVPPRKRFGDPPGS